MRRNFKFSLLACLIVFFAASLAFADEAITTITKDQLKEDLAKPDVVIIDVRANNDWASSQWKIQGAVRQVPAEAKDWVGKYSKDKTIVLYCA
jgi:rhodanese-related sulfurtransferase